MTITLSSRRRGAALAALALSTTLAVTAAGSGGATSATTDDTTGDTRVVDAENGEIEVPADPQRVAALGRSVASFLDLGGEPVGVTELLTDDLTALSEEQQAAYSGATLLGASASEADLELLATLEPDLIVISVPDADYEQLEEQLQAIAPTVWFGFSSDWNERLDVLAEATNMTDELDAQRTGYEERVADFLDTHSAAIDGIRFGEVSRGSWQETGMFLLNGSLCSEVARADLGLDIPDLGEGGEERPFEQIGELAEYDVLLYPVDHDGNVPEAFTSVMDSNAWQALPAVTTDRAVGVYCPWSRSYNFYSQYVDSLDHALASLPAQD